MGVELWVSCDHCHIPLGKVMPLTGVSILGCALECPKCLRTCGMKDMGFVFVKSRKKILIEEGMEGSEYGKRERQTQQKRLS